MLIKLFQFFLPPSAIRPVPFKKEKKLQNKPQRLPEIAVHGPSPIIHTLQVKHIP